MLHVTSWPHDLLLQIKAILRWVDETAKILPARGYEQACGVWTGPDFLPILERQFGMNEMTLESYKVLFSAVIQLAAWIDIECASFRVLERMCCTGGMYYFIYFYFADQFTGRDRCCKG